MLQAYGRREPPGGSHGSAASWSPSCRPHHGKHEHEHEHGSHARPHEHERTHPPRNRLLQKVQFPHEVRGPQRQHVSEPGEERDYGVALPLRRNGSQTRGVHCLIDADSFTSHPANTKRSPNAGLMLGQRRRRCTNIKPALGH